MASSSTCVDYATSGATLDGYRAACTMTAGSTWSTTPCTHTNSVGGCRYASGGGSGPGTVWTYTGGPYADAAAARTGCETGTPPGMYVAP